MAIVEIISEILWEKINPLLPQKEKQKGPYGRKTANLKYIFSGIIYVLRTGCQWKEVPRIYGSGSTVHKYFLKWCKSGVFQKLWQKGLVEYDEIKGIDWKWEAADGAMNKAPLGCEKTGPNPTEW